MPFAVQLNPSLDRKRPYGAAERAILSLADADRAFAVISGWPGYAPTPLVSLDRMAADTGVAAIHYKHEAHRFALKSFKALGGAYAVERLVAERGTADGLVVTCATDGNHGRAVAWGARRLNAGAVIFVHETVSQGRVDAIAAFGADVRRVAGTYDDAVRAATSAATEHGWTVVSDTSWPGYETIPRHVMQGYAVLPMECAAQGARPTHVFVQGGVGGLAAALVAHDWEKHGADRPRFIVVEPASAACLFESVQAMRWTAVGGALETIMAGLACGEPSLLAWHILQPGVDAVMTIDDADAAAMMCRLAAVGIAGGESGVAGLAGFERLARTPAAREALGLTAQSRILCYGTEGATDAEVYRSIVGQDATEVEDLADQPDGK